MFKKLRDTFQPQLDIRVSPTQIVLLDAAADMNFEPAVRVNEQGLLMEIGETVPKRGDGRLVEFFAVPHRRSRPWPPEAELTLFFRYALAVRFQNYLFTVRPRVRVLGASTLADILDGCQNEILVRALRGGGAATVEIVVDAV